MRKTPPKAHEFGRATYEDGFGGRHETELQGNSLSMWLTCTCTPLTTLYQQPVDILGAGGAVMFKQQVMADTHKHLSRLHIREANQDRAIAVANRLGFV